MPPTIGDLLADFPAWNRLPKERQISDLRQKKNLVPTGLFAAERKKEQHVARLPLFYIFGQRDNQPLETQKIRSTSYMFITFAVMLHCIAKGIFPRSPCVPSLTIIYLRKKKREKRRISSRLACGASQVTLAMFFQSAIQTFDNSL